MLVSDDDGHWYLMPEREVTRFEAVIGMAGDDDVSDTILREIGAYDRYRIDNPHTLRIYEWETP